MQLLMQYEVDAGRLGLVAQLAQQVTFFCQQRAPLHHPFLRLCLARTQHHRDAAGDPAELDRRLGQRQPFSGTSRQWS